MLNAIIVDDEPYCREILASLLEPDCPKVQVAGTCNNPDALNTIKKYSPDIVFLARNKNEFPLKKLLSLNAIAQFSENW
jgi:chemotaxis response regulator CheB